ncbi:Rec8 like protein-domain-containing protein [Yarrowia lipolytica]|uniref:YALI0A01980p n=2 Tax=Yarrowia lipolytica TaxID=4952 RepID=Q6CI41_YARLI|nr:YALI0A01980p [Yarrowia lipolytica CLIB122]AOW00156.1 hypothetical protein YALI1_A02365g [Yarrowia lipolytica]KAB8284273.1 Rec8 like protein-domain-containing protein [Yarrowia lipolytica]KAE8169879.1 Rec8 like protein-domain-containing protein [Yarrowia lipolytica]KAJ8051283.1 Rec8 like protein-domain-containing protein [Yarrowia lipolytica]QNP95037.1 Double-strand-break repair protein rad21 [Yarrowia lipolytica]|eukprot:XP_499670.1 YALI0A01980p [Yarrowia lipolytica CLIB122]
MFFSTALFQHQPGLSTVWLLATVNKSLHRREVMELQINHICKEISSPAHPMALRLSSQLMYGTVVAMHRQSSSLQADAINLRNRLSFAPLAPRSIDLPQRRPARQSLVLEDAAVLAPPPLPEIAGVPISGLSELNLPELITPEISWAFDDDDELGDLDMSFDDNGLLTDNLNIDDFVVDDELNIDLSSDYVPPSDPGVMTPRTPRSPHTPLHSSPFMRHEIMQVDDLATIQEATQTPAGSRRKRVRAAVMDEEISLKMADIRSFRDNYLENMELQKQDRRPRRKRRKGKFGQWKESVLNQCESDPILLLEDEIREMLTEPVAPRRPTRPSADVPVELETGRAGTSAQNTPASIEIARRGSAATSPWSDQGEARILGTSGLFGSRMSGSAGGTPGSGRARHSRRGGVHSRSGSFGDIDFLDEYPDPYFPDDIPGDDEYNMLSGTSIAAHEAQEFLFHLMSVCQGKTSFEAILPSTSSDGVPNDRATAATSFAKALDLATKGIIKLSGGGKPQNVFVELT